MKRGLDLVLGAVLALALTPVALVVAVVLRVVEGGPVLFRQARSGRGGRPFDFVKFRTMRPVDGADTGPADDTRRTTPLGRWLRTTSLDELPSLAHVLSGDMSLVGPRPLPIGYLPRYDDTQARRLEVRPGITGLAQVNGRNDTTWQQRLALDVWYVDHASPRLDARILARTLGTVLGRRGVDHGPAVTMTEFVGAPSSALAPAVRPLRVAHLTTVDITLALLLDAQLDSVIRAGGEVVGISAPGPFVATVEARGARHVPLTASTRGWSIRSDLRAAAQLWRALRRERPTILHTHNPKPGLYGPVVGRLAGVPIVVNTVHGLYAAPDDPLPRRIVVYALEAFSSRWSDLELVQSAEDVALMRRLRLAPRTRIRHLGNGIDLGHFRPHRLGPQDRVQQRAEWGMDDDTIVVGAVGRLVIEKGYRELFEAVAPLGPEIRLVVVGGADEEKADAIHLALVEEAAAADVVFLGYRDDVDRLLGAFDIFVLASHREGVPRAAMEASATGLPVIATNIRGCREVVDDGITGRLVPRRDAEALRAAIVDLAGRPDVRRRMGQAGRAKAEREFDQRDVVGRVLDAYAWAADRRGFRFS